MSNGLDHTVLLVISDLRHQAKVQDDELTIRCAKHVSGMWVRVEEAWDRYEV